MFGCMLLGWRPLLFGWRPSLLGACCTRETLYWKCPMSARSGLNRENWTCSTSYSHHPHSIPLDSAGHWGHRVALARIVPHSPVLFLPGTQKCRQFEPGHPSSQPTTVTLTTKHQKFCGMSTYLHLFVGRSRSRIFQDFNWSNPC